MAQDVAASVLRLALDAETRALRRSVFRLTVTVLDTCHTYSDHTALPGRTAVTRATFLAARGAGGTMLALLPLVQGSSSSVRADGGASDCGSRAGSPDLGAAADGSTRRGEGACGAAGEGEPLLVAHDAASAPAIAWYLRAQLAELLAAADARAAARIASADRAADALAAAVEASVPEADAAEAGAFAAAAADALRPVVTREMHMVMERLQLSWGEGKEAIAAGAAAGCRAASCAAPGKGEPPGLSAAEAGAIDALLASLSLGGGAARGGCAAAPSALLRHRMVLGRVGRDRCLAEGGEAVAPHAPAAAVEQAAEFVTAALGLVASWRPAAGGAFGVASALRAAACAATVDL